MLADFLTTAVRFTASSDGWVGIKVNPTLKNMGDDVLHVVHFEFRYKINKKTKTQPHYENCILVREATSVGHFSERTQQAP